MHAVEHAISSDCDAAELHTCWGLDNGGPAQHTTWLAMLRKSTADTRKPQLRIILNQLKAIQVFAEAYESANILLVGLVCEGESDWKDTAEGSRRAQVKRRSSEQPISCLKTG